MLCQILIWVSTTLFHIKALTVSFLIDVQHGGQLFSTTNMWGMYSGILKESAATNELGNNIRDAVVKNEDGTYASTSGGVLLEGYYGKVNTDGTVQYLNADGTNSDVPVKDTTPYRRTTLLLGCLWSCTKTKHFQFRLY